MSEVGTQPIATGESPATGMRSFAQRFVGAFRLDGSVFEEVASDPGALGQAAGVAAIAAIANGAANVPTQASAQVIVNAALVFAMWPILALLIWVAGRFLNDGGELGRVFRAVGFAMAPMALVAIGIAPIKWVAIAGSLVALALYFGALVVSVRPALRVDTGRSAFVCVVAGLGFVFLFMLMKLLVYQAGGGR
jgi:hypothetical protein